MPACSKASRSLISDHWMVLSSTIVTSVGKRNLIPTVLLKTHKLLCIWCKLPLICSDSQAKNWKQGQILLHPLCQLKWQRPRVNEQTFLLPYYLVLPAVLPPYYYHLSAALSSPITSPSLRVVGKYVPHVNLQLGLTSEGSPL